MHISPETPWIALVLLLLVLLAIFQEWPGARPYAAGAAGILILWFVVCQIRRKRGRH